MVLRDAFVSRTVIHVIDVLVADRASLSVVHDHVLLRGVELRVVLDVELSHLQRVLLTLYVYCAIGCVFVGCC